MFESPHKSINTRSESQEELHETQPVSSITEGSRAKKKKKKRKQQQEKPAGSAPLIRSEDSPQRAERQIEKRCIDYNSDEPIVRGIFQIGKKSHDVLLTPRRVTWTPIQPETPTGESGVAPREEGVDVKDVFAVKVKRRRSAGQHTGGTLLGITLFRCRRKGLKLKDQAVHLSNMSEDHCEVWFKHLKELLSAEGHT
ncbi:ceramide kinase-like protein [Hypomesus transpacificus]|uniref:ceramide kinase-like protein n=1 Tax=Hypomesus transpacificus TaxID=137520 RepID=UPI001F078594|nr:ceramide kinase-like protein [Hypomesus transpacificus]